jgi:dTDP-4-amino-4,6-dideoxygalactose transaminase
MLGKINGITTPFVKDDLKHAWHLYTILLDKDINRDVFFSEMRKRGIGVNVHYVPIYEFSYYSKFNLKKEDYPNTEEVFQRIITLPMHQGLGEEEISKIVASVSESIGVAKK